MNESNFIVSVLWLFQQADCRDSLIWNVRPGTEVTFAAMCSDFFYWGTADAESILPEDLPLLDQCLVDLALLDKEYLVPELFAARKRGMRPQHVVLTGLQRESPELGELFELCGPVRENDLFNPKIDRGV